MNWTPIIVCVLVVAIAFVVAVLSADDDLKNIYVPYIMCLAALGCVLVMVLFKDSDSWIVVGLYLICLTLALVFFKSETTEGSTEVKPAIAISNASAIVATIVCFAIVKYDINGQKCWQKYKIPIVVFAIALVMSMFNYVPTTNDALNWIGGMGEAIMLALGVYLLIELCVKKKEKKHTKDIETILEKIEGFKDDNLSKKSYRIVKQAAIKARKTDDVSELQELGRRQNMTIGIGEIINTYLGEGGDIIFKERLDKRFTDKADKEYYKTMLQRFPELRNVSGEKQNSVKEAYENLVTVIEEGKAPPTTPSSTTAKQQVEE